MVNSKQDSPQNCIVSTHEIEKLHVVYILQIIHCNLCIIERRFQFTGSIMGWYKKLSLVVRNGTRRARNTASV